MTHKDDSVAIDRLDDPFLVLIKVNLKKEFNNNPMYRHPGQKLVTGDVWYKQQAFRALNQALGRCIRHR